MKMTIDASELKRAEKALAKSGPAADRALRGAQRDIAQAVRHHVRRAARRHGGRIERVRVKEQGKAISIAAASPIAAIIVAGAKPHDIAPGKVMPIHSGTSVIGFAAAVSHPGFRGDPFFARGVRNAEGDIDKAMEEAGDELIADLSSRMGRRL